MEVSAMLRAAPISAQKARLVADQVRGCAVDEALNILEFSPKKAAHLIKKLLDSAIANAENNQQLDVDRLVVSEATAGRQFVIKRWRARARGRVGRIIKPFSNLTIVVREREETV